jgi:glycosyltransferase involved in cell wall biosynthesis
LNKKRYALGIVDPGDVSKNVSGGSTGFISSVLPYFDEQKVTIFGIGRNGASPWKPSYLRNNITFISVSDLRFPSRIPMRLKCFVSYFLNRKKIIKTGMDVLYIHSPECCLPFLFNNKIVPVIYHQHGSANPVVRSKYAYARNRFFQGIFNLIMKLIYNKADWIIAIDRPCIAQAAQNGAGKKASLLMNAVDTEKFKPNKFERIKLKKHFGLSEDQHALIFVGRIEKPKGPGRLLECVPYLNAQGLDFHVFIAGDGTYRANLEEYVLSHGFETQVTFLGHISNFELPRYYNMADILILPSEMEGVPMVILEALACGTPVVASNVGGISDLIIDAINGMILCELSPERISSAIIDVLHLNITRETVSQSIVKFSAKRFVSEFNKISNQVIAVRR